jgi:phytanoyl-CoA hydroxylase
MLIFLKKSQVFKNLNSLTATNCLLSKCSALKFSSASPSTLTPEQSTSYENNGFFVVPKLISSEKLDAFKNRFQKICSEKIRVPAMTVMKDVAIAKSEFLQGEKAITKIQDFCHDDELFEYCCLSELVQYVTAITGPNAMAMHTMLINKPPGMIYKSKTVFIFKVF